MYFLMSATGTRPFTSLLPMSSAMQRGALLGRSLPAMMRQVRSCGGPGAHRWLAGCCTC